MSNRVLNIVVGKLSFRKKERCFWKYSNNFFSEEVRWFFFCSWYKTSRSFPFFRTSLKKQFRGPNIDFQLVTARCVLQNDYRWALFFSFYYILFRKPILRIEVLVVRFFFNTGHICVVFKSADTFFVFTGTLSTFSEF